MSCDIIETMPWSCGGDDGCTQLWHLRNYWCDTLAPGGYTVDEYADGDHESIDEADLPSYEEVQAAWKEYFEYVLETGADPLGNFYVKHVIVRKERWQFRFKRAIVGAVLAEARHAGRRYNCRKLPKHVTEYLNLGAGWALRLQDFETHEAFLAIEGLRFDVWVTQHIEHKIDRSPAALARDLRRAARKALKRHV